VKAWCPRCDAVRPGETSCPVCGTALAVLEDPPPQEPDAPPPPQEPAAPPPRSRLRLALLAAAVTVAGLAFVAGRSGTPPAAAPATTGAAAAPATTAAAAEPDADARELGWRAGPRRGVTLTVVEARRVLDPDEDTAAVLTVRVEGLEPGQRLLALRGLRLLDSGGGVYSSPEEQPVGDQAGIPLEPTDDPATYLLFTSPAPRLGALASVEVGDLLVVRPRGSRIELDSSGPWPAAAPLRPINPGPRDTVDVPAAGPATVPGDHVSLRVTAAFVGAGRAVVVVEPDLRQGDVLAGGTLPVSGELRAGGQACNRTVLLGQGTSGFGMPDAAGLVLSCRARPVARLQLTLGAGVERLPFDATLKQ
jgi:hypothetical protein